MYDHETITPLGNEINPPLESSEISVKAPTYHPNIIILQKLMLQYSNKENPSINVNQFFGVQSQC